MANKVKAKANQLMMVLVFMDFDIPDENCQPKWGTWTKMNCSDDDGKAIVSSKQTLKFMIGKSCAETKLSNFTSLS